jgi:hypothetical protein
VFVFAGLPYRLMGDDGIRTMKVVHNGGSKPVEIVLDSPAIRELIATDEAKESELQQALATESHTFQEQRQLILPVRTQFLGAMARAPHVTTKEKTRCRVLEISRARCSTAPEATITFVRVVLTNGSSKGQQVWICRNPYSLPFEEP